MPKKLILDMPPPKDIIVLGHRIRYWEQGEGDPIVLVHGFSGSAAMEWAPVIPGLAKRNRVIALQVIGFEPSEQPDMPYTTEVLVRHLGEFMRALKLTNITLVGESFGGWHVAAYAVHAAALGQPAIARLALIGGAVCVKKFPGPDAKGFVDPELQAAAEKLPPEFRTVNDATRMAIVRDSGLRGSDPTREQLAGITVPTLLLWGDKDELIPLECGQDAATLIPKSRLVVLNGIGHIPSVEAPDDFIRIVSDFANS
ncbi:MAG: alpha/beta hydrolase [Alphaproteobacteria bacterium]|nr:alpha/beta hydrolase [Alphaproteobacteria bacterium]MBV9421230.1 alpha/beta hydrolase [Alphaproteobacteria bacterium]MBV9539677.1 alpha/beta hydrolase [Alphaproteobacteria bacterium]MBV9903012.1 alpha/beta hydrolase [Alphaproteobacteria bacterium]